MWCTHCQIDVAEGRPADSPEQLRCGRCGQGPEITTRVCSPPGDRAAKRSSAAIGENDATAGPWEWPPAESDWELEEDLRLARHLARRGDEPLGATVDRLALGLDRAGGGMPPTSDALARALPADPLAQPVAPMATAVSIGRWTPFFFAATALLGGFLAVGIGQLWPRILPAVLVAELGMAILLVACAGTRK